MSAEDRWGRVDDDGNVYVRTADGERVVGSWQAGDPDGALEFFRRKYEAIALEVELLASRIDSAVISPDDADKAIRRERKNVEEAQAVGDLDSLLQRLSGLESVVAERRTQRREERRRQLDEARQTKVAIVEEGEQLAAGEDWKRGVNRFRELLEQWKALPRLDRQTDDELWRRFSTARTSYTRRRKQHFTELNARREDARQVKEQLAREAESVADTTDWARGANRLRDLMQRWKAAGAAPRDVEEQLWKRFRAAQDRFFAARNEAFAEQDAKQRENLVQKEQLLAEAEALVPVRDHRAARKALRDIQQRWDQAGKVPRDAMRRIENRFRKVEDAVKAAEQQEWRRTDPETQARVSDTLGQLRSSIEELEARLEKARASGDQSAIRKATEALDSRRAWLAEVEKTLDDLSG